MIQIQNSDSFCGLWVLPGWLTRVVWADVLSQHHLRLILQVLHLFWIFQPTSLCGGEETLMWVIDSVSNVSWCHSYWQLNYLELKCPKNRSNCQEESNTNHYYCCCCCGCYHHDQRITRCNKYSYGQIIKYARGVRGATLIQISILQCSNIMFLWIMFSCFTGVGVFCIFSSSSF